MTTIIIKPLPHSPSIIEAVDDRTRRLFMQLIENTKSLKKQLEEAQKAIQELQRR